MLQDAERNRRTNAAPSGYGWSHIWQWPVVAKGLTSQSFTLLGQIRNQITDPGGVQGLDASDLTHEDWMHVRVFGSSVYPSVIIRSRLNKVVKDGVIQSLLVTHYVLYFYEVRWSQFVRELGL